MMASLPLQEVSRGASASTRGSTSSNSAPKRTITSTYRRVGRSSTVVGYCLGLRLVELCNPLIVVSGRPKSSNFSIFISILCAVAQLHAASDLVPNLQTPTFSLQNYSLLDTTPRLFLLVCSLRMAAVSCIAQVFGLASPVKFDQN